MKIMKKRQQKSPYDFFNEDIYKWLLHEMQSMIKDIYFIEKLQKKLRLGLGINKQFIYDPNTNFLPVWSPEIQETNSYSLKIGNSKPKSFVESERLIDIIEGDQDIAVTIEIPNVEKNDITLYITEDSLEMTVDSTFLKYHKMLKLPCDVNAETARASYRNGVLDVVIKKNTKLRK
jgi:HSP20 family protein